MRRAGEDEGRPTETLGEAVSTETSKTVGTGRSSAPGGDELGELPERIGPYEVIGLLGRGGMGLVVEARQRRPQRRVAIKIMETGPLADPVRRLYFEREAESLGRLEHPHIATIHEASITEQGVPYLVMERVDGVTLHEYVKRYEPVAMGAGEARQLVELVAKVCDGVAAAHRRGIIHRDLKASNIMVVETAEGPVPKILDFGLAKSMEVHDDLTVRLGRSHAIRGTLPYMSPEQAGGDADVDVRSDVYALGVVLFRALTQRLPLDVTSSSLPDAIVAIASAERARLADVCPGASWVDGELESILAKAMARDRGRRYSSAESLAADLRRYLRGEAISAVAPSLWYRGRKFARRNWLPLLAAAGVVVALAVGLVTTRGALARARLAESEAVAAQRTSEEAFQFLFELFRGSDPRENPGADLTARDLLERGVDGVAELEDQPRVQARLLWALGEVYWALGEFDRAEDLLERSVARFDTLASRDIRPMENEHVLALNRLGKVALGRGEPQVAEAIHRRALALLDDREFPEEALLRGSTLNDLGVALRRSRRFPEARRALERSLALTESRPDHEPVQVGALLNNLAAVSSGSGEYQAARDYLERALRIFEGIVPPNHPSLATLNNNLSLACRRVGDLAAALRHIEAAVAIDREVLPEGHPALGEDLENRAAVRQMRGELDAAEQDLRSALAIHRGATPDGFAFHRASSTLGHVLLDQRRFGESRELLDRAAKGFLRLDHPARDKNAVTALRLRAQAELWDGDGAAARATADRTLELASSAGGAGEASDAALALLQIATLEARRGEAMAGERYRDAVERAGCETTRPCALDRPVTGVFRALYWAAAEPARVREHLEVALERDEVTAGLLTPPDLDPYRSEAWFQDLEAVLRSRLAGP